MTLQIVQLSFFSGRFDDQFCDVHSIRCHQKESYSLRHVSVLQHWVIQERCWVSDSRHLKSGNLSDLGGNSTGADLLKNVHMSM